MDAGIEALRPALETVARSLDLEVSEAEYDALLNYLKLLERWNATYNLTAVRHPSAMLVQHLADCLAVVSPLRRELAGTALATNSPRLLDVGSGGGLPGVVIAILMPNVDVTCVDTVGKKAAFIQQAAVDLKLRKLHSAHARVEQLALAPFDVVTSRAFASLPDFTRLTRSSVAASGIWMAMKGKIPRDEIALLPDDIEVFHVEQLAVPQLHAERCIVWMHPKSLESASL